jgi:GLPGLI family protein
MADFVIFERIRLLMKTLLALLFSVTVFAQPGLYKITYLKSSNGKILEDQDPVVVFADDNQTIVTSQAAIDKKAEYPYEIIYVDRKSFAYSQLAYLSADGRTLMRDSTAIGKQTFEITNETKIILGYKCEKAKTVINSNQIELWFTRDLPLRAAPGVLGNMLGLVLEVTRNGNFSTTAIKVEPASAIPASVVFKDTKLKAVDPLTYRDQLWKSRYTTIPVFRKQVINYSTDAKSDAKAYRFANGTIIARKVRFPVIKPGSQVFVDLTQQSNGDAYDRTGSVFIIPNDRRISFLNGLQESVKSLPVYDNGNGKFYQGVAITPDYLPLTELMRFYTPFGVAHYNTIKLKGRVWQDSAYYRQDVSDLRTMLSGKEVWIGVNIGNYDKGGHRVSLNLTVHPDQSKINGDNFVLPLFNTNNVMEMAGQEYGTMFDNDKGLTVNFTLDKPVKNAKLRYITTGHGGWENGDEFVPKKNTILLNGNPKFEFTPWRTDCGSYRTYNPASGNFDNGLSSSDYSRSNWCPGTVTPPTYIDLGDLSAGDHSIQIKIPQGKPEGTSFSSWNVSGVLLGTTE